MISVISGDIINSRKTQDHSKWLIPLKKLLAKYGRHPKGWIIERGDSFQLEIQDPEECLKAALKIKSLIKSLQIKNLDVRIAIGIGNKTYQGTRVSESNGEAFINSGEKFESLRRIKQNLAIKTPWEDINIELNLMFKLASVFMDKWTFSSAEVIQLLLKTKKQLTQKDLVKVLKLNQSSVSERLSRAHSDEIMELEQYFRNRISQQLKK